MFKSKILSAIIIAAALLALSSLVLLIPISFSVHFLPEQFEELRMQDSMPQQIAHAVWVLFISMTCIVILTKPKQ